MPRAKCQELRQRGRHFLQRCVHYQVPPPCIPPATFVHVCVHLEMAHRSHRWYTAGSPDPIDKSKPLTVYASGTFTAPITAFTASLDLHVKALGIIDIPVHKTAPVTISPALQIGNANFTVGPFSLPHVPGSADIAGTIKVADPTGKQIFCAELNVVAAAPDAMVKETLTRDNAPIAQPQDGIKVKNCGAASDHFKNPVVSAASGAVKLTGTLDEEVASGFVDLDLDLKVSFFKIPIKMHIPFKGAGSFVFPKGKFSLSAGPLKSKDESVDSLSPQHPNLDISIDGNAKFLDAQSEEVACIQVDGSAPVA